ncbi:putative RNA methyltransferase CT0009 [Drosera capensis]
MTSSATLSQPTFRHLHHHLRLRRHFSTTTAFASLHPVFESQEENKNDSFSSSKGGFFPKRGETVELVCESLGFKGKGICKVTETGFVVMCDGALPGERFLGRVTRKKGSYAEVKKLQTFSPHWDIVDAPCEYASTCGGCKTQNLLYEAQIRIKEQQVRELMVHVGKFSDRSPEFAGIMKPIVPCAKQFHYRNKMEFSFSTQEWLPNDLIEAEEYSTKDCALGLHAPGFFDKVLNIKSCLLQSEPANMVLSIVQECWRNPELSLSPYNVYDHSGFLKHLVLRTGRNPQTGLMELMVNFVTSLFKPELLKPLVKKISCISEVVSTGSIVNNVNKSTGSTAIGEVEHVLYGKPTISEVLRGLTFQISANSFFQTNTHQAEVLYWLIEDVAGLRGDGSEIVLDLFCGTGTIGLTLAKRVGHVYGYEVVAQAVSDARQNAELNGIHNATFVQGDLNKIDDNFGKNFPKPDIVISDPNRPGMHIKLIKFLLKLKAKRIIYVSCNPATCARDLDYLCHGLVRNFIIVSSCAFLEVMFSAMFSGLDYEIVLAQEGDKIEGCYRLISVQPVDMFPHTPHIECVCLLELPSS